LISAAVLCLASVVYHEARGEPLVGQVAVAHVVLNRAARDLRRVCHEVKRPRQFHWRPLPRDPRAWLTALRVATAAPRLPDITDGATHFDSNGRAPWVKSMQVTRKWGRHTFYRLKK
jgi:spore germination cell wall hydrolase CwlJ-like protein